MKLTRGTLLIFLTATCMAPSALGVKIPTGCSLSFGDFTCDYRNCVPLHGMDFEPPPQRLTVEEIYGTFEGADFYNFTHVNRTAFDPNFDATLTLKCRHSNGIGGLLTLTDSSFTDMDFYQTVTIRDCDIEVLPENAFQHLVSLNVLAFQGGYMSIVHPNAFQNLQIQPDPSALVPKGEFSMVDVDYIPAGFVEEIFAPLTELRIIIIQHSRISFMRADVFRNQHQVHTVILDDNPLTYLRSSVFKSMGALSRVSFVNIPWQCTCPNLWFLEDFSSKHVTIESEVVCADPPDWAGIRAENYWDKNCKDDKCEQGTLPSVDLGIMCLTYLQIAIYTMACIGFCLLVPVIIEWRRMSSKASKMGEGGIRMMTPRRPPPRQRAPMGHARGFPAAKQAMYGNSGGGMAYPAGSFA